VRSTALRMLENAFWNYDWVHSFSSVQTDEFNEYCQRMAEGEN